MQTNKLSRKGAKERQGKLILTYSVINLEMNNPGAEHRGILLIKCFFSCRRINESGGF